MVHVAPFSRSRTWSSKRYRCPKNMGARGSTLPHACTKAKGNTRSCKQSWEKSQKRNLPSHNDISATRRHGSFLLASPKNCIQLINCREVLGEVRTPFRQALSFSSSSGVSAMWKGSWLPQSGRWKILATSSSVGLNSPYEQINVYVSVLHRLTTCRSILASIWMS
ncbi:hypothetical protein L3X38_042676 [Prunus dulcis]|uniref:Uncharacterized protein n=1 Tax=Prunus dulcis TaxID=3755 RepID=A0AAD4UV06_PRUDU|nr:hypothetical protein L3X38_042676 [Prunus dulcis]